MLFHEWDTNHSGLLEFRELNSQMRQTVAKGESGKELKRNASTFLQRSKDALGTSKALLEHTISSPVGGLAAVAAASSSIREEDGS